MAGFLLDIRHWPTADDFEKHLSGYDPAIASWAEGVTLHHTYIPRTNQWLGEASIKGMVTFYKGKGWTAGPHLYVAKGAPNPAHDGIWQMTPLNLPGIHGTTCNAHYWGIEVVGDYDDAPWPTSLRDLVLETTAALMRWRDIPVSPTTIKGHRDCPSTKTCPGNAINLAQVRSWLSDLLTATLPIVEPRTLTERSPLMGAPTCTQDQATRYLLSRPHANYTNADLSLTIIPGYWALATSVGLNPAVPLAQLVKEGSLNSFWGARPQRNPAGIGVDGTAQKTKPSDATGWAFNTDRQQWEKGISFATWVNGSIDAHVGRLVAWATEPGSRTPAQQAAVHKALAYRDLATGLQGSATELRYLGRIRNPSGKGWASPGSDYGEKLSEIMTAMGRI